MKDLRIMRTKAQTLLAECLARIDKRIDALTAKAEAATKEASRARKARDSYLSALSDARQERIDVLAKLQTELQMKVVVGL